MDTDETPNANQPGGALSIYGQTDAAMDDFPVLKAFQQYIDAEQSKARKRMILLCMFFGVLMTVLVAAFMLVLGQMNRDKQQANEQLIQFLMKERERPQTVAAPQPAAAPASNPANDAALKAMTETLAALKEQMAAQQKAAEEQAERAPSKAELEREQKAEIEAEKIRKAQAQLAEEKRRLADEKERLRQQEIERQRRRLYPDYYKKQEAAAQEPAPAAAPAKPAPRKVELTDEDIDDIFREIDSVRANDERRKADEAKKKAALEKKKAKQKAKEKKDSKDLDRPIEYFSDSEYALPVKVNGEDAGFTIPLPND